MRRSRLAQILGGSVMMAALLLPSSALASSAAPVAGATAAPQTTTVPTIKVTCSLVVQNVFGPAAPRRANVCTWVAPAGITVATYRVWRVVDRNPATRTLLAGIPATQRLRYADFALRAGHDYTYFVTGIGEAGTRVAVSNRVTIHVGRTLEKLAMSCALTTGDVKAVACRWSAATRPNAARYHLVRSVDGAARQRIYNVWLHGRRSFTDVDVKPGQTIRYAVLAVTSTGRVVSIGGPIVVAIPAASPIAPAN